MSPNDVPDDILDHCEWVVEGALDNANLIEINYELPLAGQAPDDPVIVVRNGHKKLIVFPHLTEGVGATVALYKDGKQLVFSPIGDAPEIE